MSLFKPLPARLLCLYQLLVWLVLVVVMALPVSAATIGVGVGTGKIHQDNPLLPGLSYVMPSVMVFNSGDTESDYEMTVQYNENQPERKPPANWITFTPQQFKLKPGGSQEVKIMVKSSSMAEPYKYFAYLEAHPLKTDTSGSTNINVAAATKFTFEIAAANRWQRLYYMVLDFWNRNRHVLVPVLSLVGLAVIFLLARKFFKLERRHKKWNFRR